MDAIDLHLNLTPVEHLILATLDLTGDARDIVEDVAGTAAVDVDEEIINLLHATPPDVPAAAQRVEDAITAVAERDRDLLRKVRDDVRGCFLVTAQMDDPGGVDDSEKAARWWLAVRSLLRSPIAGPPGRNSIMTTTETPVDFDSLTEGEQPALYVAPTPRTADEIDATFAKIDKQLIDTQLEILERLPEAEQRRAVLRSVLTMQSAIAQIDGRTKAATWARPTTFVAPAPYVRQFDEEYLQHLDDDVKAIAASWYGIPRWLRAVLTGQRQAR